ncbi:MAG: hypothetical protein KGV59_01380 [Tenacibaculum sp.]|nr:hypothetical protein [Tenacibaculum sp.]
METIYNIEDYPRIVKEYVWVKLLWAIEISIFVPILGCLWVIYRGYINWNKQTEERLKAFNGYSCSMPEKFPISAESKKRNRRKAIGYFITGLFGVWFWIYIINVSFLI